MNQSRIYEVCCGIQDTIRNLEMQGPAVFIGRCFTEILRGNPEVVRTYIYSSEEENKVERIVRTEKVSREQARKLMAKKDRQRSSYFKYWTQKKWEDRKNYDMELNTAELSPNVCVHILLAVMKA